MIVEPVLNTMLEILAAASGGAAVSAALVAYFGRTWVESLVKRRHAKLDHEMKERLAKTEQEYRIDMRGLGLKVDLLLSSANKLTDREFNALPETWSTLSEAMWTANDLLAFFYSPPDISHLDEEGLRHHLSEVGVPVREQDRILSAGTMERNSAFDKWLNWNRLQKALIKAADVNRSIVKNSIFMTEEVRSKFDELAKLISNALFEEQREQRHPKLYYERKSRDALESEGEDLHKQLETLIHARLWRAHHAESPVSSRTADNATEPPQ